MPGNVPPVADERSGLLAFLAQQRQGVRNAAFGLTDEQARLAPVASTLSVGGLVKHLAQMERSWVATMLQRPSAAVDYEDGFVLRADETLADVLADYVKAGEETDAAVAGIADMGQPVPVPKGVPWFPDDVDAWSVRWVLLHLIEETARHAGHADIVREAVDGATCWPLMAAAEGWPATPWVQPWQPATGTAQPV
ncbi:DinB family protein [Dactylosporangium sp. NPDC049742]|uniref:DinB family protein n=1 Tax=Dactylosporangium sp. NPDC049742 TaxID=3154737 RepID=UPI00343A1A6D